MLALRRRSRQVVVADEKLNGADVVGQLLGERKGLAHQTGKALSQGIVEPFDVVRFPRFFRDGLVALCRDHAIVYVILIRVKHGVVLIHLRDLRSN